MKSWKNYLDLLYRKDKFYIDLLSVLEFDLDDDITTLLFQKDRILYDTYDDIIPYLGPKSFLLFCDKFSRDEIKKSILIMITFRENITLDFINYICTKYPHINYQKLLEESIKELYTDDDIKEPTSKRFENILKCFELSGIGVNYEQLFNVARQNRHVNISIFLYLKINAK